MKHQKKQEFQIISFDAYDTLFPVSPQIEKLGPLLSKNYPDDWDKNLWARLTDGISQFFHERRFKGSDEFVNARYVYRFALMYSQLNDEIDISIDDAVELITKAHAEAEALPGAGELIQSLRSHSKMVVLCTDSDNDFLARTLAKNNLSFDLVVSSESVRGYKTDQDRGVFHHLLESTKENPEEILHIGDSLSDIVGAQKLGICVWLFNPMGKELPLEMPDCQRVHSFNEIENRLIALGQTRGCLPLLE
jgi:putative hydrolase of the HAD superfamily